MGPLSIVAVGISYKTAPVGLLEQLSIGEDDLPKALHQLSGYEHLEEGAILSTCNRTEVYAAVSKFHGGAQDIRNFFAEFCHIAPEDFSDHLYTFHDEGALRHLFKVASGIDSMIVGESEILGQVRRAFTVAAEEEATRRLLSSAFRHALRVGKRVRNATSIGRNPASVSSAAVERARRAFPDRSLTGKRIAILGAGKMGTQTARALADAGASDLVVVNRTEQTGLELAELFGARSRPFEDLPEVLRSADIVICSTTAPAVVIDKAMLAAARSDRGDDRLLMIDIAVPRDVDPLAAEVPGVELCDIDDLRAVVESSIGQRVAELPKAEGIISAEIDRFVEWQRGAELAPTTAALVSSAELIRLAELERVSGGLAGLSAEQRSLVDHLTRRLVAKLLHVPLKRARELTDSDQGHVYLATLRELFELEEDLPDDLQ